MSYLSNMQSYRYNRPHPESHLISDVSWSAAQSSANLYDAWMYSECTVCQLATYVSSQKKDRFWLFILDVISKNTEICLTGSKTGEEISYSAKPPAGPEKSWHHGLPPPPASLASAAQQRPGTLISTGLEKKHTCACWRLHNTWDIILEKREWLQTWNTVRWLKIIRSDCGLVLLLEFRAIFDHQFSVISQHSCKCHLDQWFLTTIQCLLSCGSDIMTTT